MKKYQLYINGVEVKNLRMQLRTLDINPRTFYKRLAKEGGKMTFSKEGNEYAILTIK